MNKKLNFQIKKKFDSLKRQDPENFKILKDWTNMLSRGLKEDGQIVTSLPSGEYIAIGKAEIEYLNIC